MATLSFLKLVKKWPKNAVRNLAVCYGTIWRRREKPQYRCTTTIYHVHKSPKDVLENLLPVWLLVRMHNIVHSEPVLDYLYEIWQLLAALYSDMRNFFYIGAHLHSPPYTTAVQFLSNRSTIYTKWCAQTLPSIFGFFAMFNSNFVNIAVM